jgi:hypothetical protein
MKILIVDGASTEAANIMAQLDATNSGIELVVAKPEQVDFVLTADPIRIPEIETCHFIEKSPRRSGQKQNRWKGF